MMNRPHVSVVRLARVALFVLLSACDYLQGPPGPQGSPGPQGVCDAERITKLERELRQLSDLVHRESVAVFILREDQNGYVYGGNGLRATVPKVKLQGDVREYTIDVVNDLAVTRIADAELGTQTYRNLRLPPGGHVAIQHKNTASTLVMTVKVNSVAYR